MGTIHTTLNIGNVRHTDTFHVLKYIDGFDAIVGTRFLQHANVMEKMFAVAKDCLGEGKLFKGN